MPLHSANYIQVPNPSATGTDTVAVTDAEEDDDFKAMYHATYRAFLVCSKTIFDKCLPYSSRVFTTTSTSISESHGSVCPSPQVPILEKGRAMDLVDGVVETVL
jgi:hypothetical protein